MTQIGDNLRSVKLSSVDKSKVIKELTKDKDLTLDEIKKITQAMESYNVSKIEFTEQQKKYIEDYQQQIKQLQEKMEIKK